MPMAPAVRRLQPPVVSPIAQPAGRLAIVPRRSGGFSAIQTPIAQPARPGLSRTAQVVQRAAASNDDARYQQNYRRIATALGQIYEWFYPDGDRDAARAAHASSFIYRMLGYEQSDYLGTPLANLGGLLAADDKDYSVTRQVKKGSGADKTVRGTDLNKPNYYHVHNSHYVKPEGVPRNARRIVANVATQQDTMRVFERLVALFRSGGAEASHIKEFKVYVGNADKTVIKKDKLVVYYDYVAGPGGADSVGDAIVALVQSAGATFGEDLAPFYSAVAPGIAWAEEPKFHSEAKEMQGSFTRTRASVITAVVAANARVATLPQFIELVTAAFAGFGIDLRRAHRHA